MSTSIIWIGMDVHKDTVMVAMYLNEARKPDIVQQLPNDSRKLKRFFERWSRGGEIRGCYEGERGRLRTAARDRPGPRLRCGSALAHPGSSR